MKEKLIYLDNNSTTALDQRVLEAMLPLFKNNYANSSSIHSFGESAKRFVDDSRQEISSLLNCLPKELLFTSGATESINLALKGLALSTSNKKKHIITLQTEHRAVLDTCRYLETIGFEVDYLPVRSNGLLDLDIFLAALRADTFLVSIMWANNETGVIQPIKDLCDITRSRNIFFFTDATQAVGKIAIDLQFYEGIDFLCFSPHKFHGPKGIGGLYFNSRTVSSKNLAPLLHGGGHEYNFRSGTLNVPAIVGFSTALKIASSEMTKNSIYVANLRDKLEMDLLQIEGSRINGIIESRLYNTTNISFPNLDANMLINKYKWLAVSNGSACSAALVEPSHVLTAMGLNDEDAFSAIRFSLSKFNDEQDVLTAVNGIKESLIKLEF